MIYKRKPKALFGMDLSQLNLKEGLKENPQDLSAPLQMGSKLLKKAGTDDLGYGVSFTSDAAKIGSGVMSGTAKGAALGSVLGPKGALVGAGMGAAAGLVSSGIEAITDSREEALEKRNSLERKEISANNKSSASTYNALEQKQLMAQGGELPDGADQPSGDQAVVLGGDLHSQGGNDIVDENGQKVAETEREEIIFTKEQTEMIEKSIQKIKSGNEDEYLQLGAYVKDILLNRTIDYSGKFNPSNDADLS